MAAQLPPQLSVPFSLFLLGFFDPSFSFLSFSLFFLLLLLLLPSCSITICPPTSVSLCPLDRRKTLRNCTEMDALGGEESNPHQSLPPSATPEKQTKTQLNIGIYFLIFLFFAYNLRLSIHYWCVSEPTLECRVLFQPKNDFQTKFHPKSNKQIVKKEREKEYGRKEKRFIWSVREPAVKRHNSALTRGSRDLFQYRSLLSYKPPPPPLIPFVKNFCSFIIQFFIIIWLLWKII